VVSKLITAIVVAVIVAIVVFLIGALLVLINIDVIDSIGVFLQSYAGLIGLLAGLYHFFLGDGTIGGRRV
jgi:uncharacterized Tic20 family protein